ncbi:MAG: hypothetical protein V3U87_02555 [Methylococcaceae bacterium]
MSEKTIHIQQAILPERLEKLIIEELIRVSGSKVGFSWQSTELEGVVKVNVVDEVLIPFVTDGIIEIAEVRSQPAIVSDWNQLTSTYQLEDGVDIEDVF